MPRLAAVLTELRALDGWIASACFDPTVPYGRTVVLAEPELELMVAGWSRGRPCAPHDHGPGHGAVRVLEGRARHRGFALRHGALVADPDEVLEPGAVLRCPPGWIHQMQDDGAARPLITLHLYAGSTAPMAVYDLEQPRTQWLGPGCGAWPRPVDDPAVVRWRPGFVDAAERPALTPC